MSTDYITSTALKKTLTLANTSFADDDVAAAITAASRSIDDICQRHFYKDIDANAIRYYTPVDRACQEIDDLVALTTLQTDPDGDGTFDQTWTLGADFDLLPLNAALDTQNVKPWTSIGVRRRGAYIFPAGAQKSVKIVGTFGWPAVPGAIVNATTLLANLLLTVSRSAPLGIVPFEGGAIRVARGNPQVMMLLAPYMRHRIGVG